MFDTVTRDLFVETQVTFLEVPVIFRFVDSPLTKKVEDVFKATAEAFAVADTMLYSLDRNVLVTNNKNDIIKIRKILCLLFM